MEQFRPSMGIQLNVGGKFFGFVRHPLFPGDNEAVFVLEGGEALIYQLRDVQTGDLYALKVMKAASRSEHVARAARVVSSATHIPGFYLYNRFCLTMAEFPDLIKTYPDLEYAVLMPWLTGRSWSGLMLDRISSAYYTRQRACALALTVANLLRNLESMHLAHTDIAGGNIFLSPDLQRVQLLDLEGLYIPGVLPPPLCSQGSPGYQHHNPGPKGQWCPEGDRFAGAILLAEMLTWWNPSVRALVADQADTLFQPAELQTNSSRCLQEVRKTLLSMHANLLSLFDYAWGSSSLVECPDFASWYGTLISSLR
jgi:serine/threonine protein kinase